jgi:two-component system phosphate regulon response regulator PhoB
MTSDQPQKAKAKSSSSGSAGGAPARASVLVVEDEQDLQDLLRYNLARDGFVVRCASTGEEAVASARQQAPDLVLLDLMLPGIDGLEVCRGLRAHGPTSRTPIVMLTAKGEEADIVAGLELGADDYVTKPFSPRVLLARLKAVLRRQPGVPPQSEAGRTAVEHGEVSIDPERHEVRIAGDLIELTATEFRLLGLLASRPGLVFTRQQIITSLHGSLSAVTDRSVDVQVLTLRRKLGDHAELIQTVRGVGYRFRDQPGE